MKWLKSLIENRKNAIRVEKEKKERELQQLKEKQENELMIAKETNPLKKLLLRMPITQRVDDEHANSEHFLLYYQGGIHKIAGGKQNFKDFLGIDETVAIIEKKPFNDLRNNEREQYRPGDSVIRFNIDVKTDTNFGYFTNIFTDKYIVRVDKSKWFVFLEKREVAD